MKQFITILFFSLCTLAILSAFGSNHCVFADTVEVGISINGTAVEFPDVKPYISDNRTFVPLRSISEQLDASVDWKSDTGTIIITKDDDSIKLVIGNTEVFKNGVSSSMDVAPVIMDGRTMVPLRFVSEQLDAVVNWDASNNSVSIITVSSETPEVSRGGGRTISLSCTAEEFIEYAEEYLGAPYAYGGASPSGFDCSGFTHYVAAHFGGYLPHSSSEQYSYGISIEKEDLLPGDLVFFGTSGDSKTIGHVGIYIGDGKFIHAPQAGGCVEISNLSNVYFDQFYYGAIRMDTEEAK
jgi:hypothetical protein